jgi:hypothetical protein
MNQSTNQYYVHVLQVHILYQSEFSAECDLVLPLSNPVSSLFPNPLDYRSKRTLEALAA